ncbi:hypothetical protein IAU60_001967 [Kwoniella sp. DSM 27419]
MTVLRAYHLARLTRPARIHLGRSIGTTAGRSKPNSHAAALAERDEDEEYGYEHDRDPGNGTSPHAQGYRDFQEALEMAKEVKSKSTLKGRRPGLPTLRRKETFGEPTLPVQAPVEASSSRRPGESPLEAPAGAVRISRKGKERAVEGQQGDPAVQPLAPIKDGQGLRRNPVGVQLLSESLHGQLFPGSSLPKPPRTLLDISKRHLKDNGLSPEGAAVLPEISFKMPRLRGHNIRDHFLALGQHTAEPYLSLAKDFLTAELPDVPERWEMTRPGWTKYHPDGRAEAVQDLGDEQVVSFDVETLYKLSSYPVMATAVTPHAWYSWLSPTIFDDPPGEPTTQREAWDRQAQSHHPHDLIPLFQGPKARIVIGHNVGYDRARVKEEYSLERTATRWLDTLSLHVATRGITSVQRPAWMAHRKNKKAKALREQESREAFQELAEEQGDPDMLEGLEQWGNGSDAEAEASQNKWEDVTSVNSLAEVAALHCGIPVDKSIRNRFGDEDITHASHLRGELHQLLTYCAGDVKVTHEVYKKVLPLFLESCPHPASFSGVLSMGNSFLPVNESWQEYLKQAETTYQEMDKGVKKALRVLAEKLRSEGHNDADPWTSQLDWTPKAARWAEPNREDDMDAASSLSSEADQTTSQATDSAASPQARQSSPTERTLPAWYSPFATDPALLASSHTQRYTLPLILRMTYKGHPVVYLAEHCWCFMVPHDQLTDHIDAHGCPVELNHKKDRRLEPLEDQYTFFRIGRPGESRKTKLSGPAVKALINNGDLRSPHEEVLKRLAKTDLSGVVDEIWPCVEELKRLGPSDPWSRQLDWSAVSDDSVTAEAPENQFGTLTADVSAAATTSRPSQASSKSKSAKTALGTWPKWYWDLTGPPSRLPPGELDLTFKKTISPLLLRLQWQGYPLIHSRTHKWLYRVPRAVVHAEDAAIGEARGKEVKFDKTGPDAELAADREHDYFRLPHKDGEGKNVGNPLSKHFVKSIESGELASAAAESGDDVAARAATDATNMNAFCSYWISSRERIMDQMVVYQSPSSGMILPQVITMGTVTRRAVEATWLTASNAKKNRVGSELKAMVRAPPGYSIVGADVDSEELWISSVMGDSQFGMHGATAIGWMTLEGTKSAGTDLHSKTANILGISRDAAKVFNYSRIYGAGKKHAVQLLLQGDTKLTKEAAGKLADNLYKATKGTKSVRNKSEPPAAIQSIWHGGSESYLFNTLEAIALSDRPTTPALGCGITKALRKSYLEEGSSYLPSRVNWVVQSSGVDYLHLLIVSMEYLLAKYNINARYLISVHDEVRYLAKEEDRYRTALALQIANAWTRALFCFNLGMDDMPQGIAFFSAVDVDHVLRKEVFLTCETPSHPHVIPSGESLDIDALLQKTAGDLGTPNKDDLDELVPSSSDIGGSSAPPVSLFPDIQSPHHRQFLEAQASAKGEMAKVYLNGLPSIADRLDQASIAKLKPTFRRAMRGHRS